MECNFLIVCVCVYHMYIHNNIFYICVWFYNRSVYTTYYNTGNFSVYGSSKFKPSRTSPVNNELKQQGGAGETSRTTNYVQGLGNTRARRTNTLQSVRQTCPCTVATRPYRFARFPFCGIFTPIRGTSTKYQSSKTTTLETTGVGTGETSGTKTYELHGKGWATRAPVAETLQTGGQFKSYIVT